MKTHKMPSMGKFQSVENYDGKPNQFIIRFEKGIVLQSYESIIVVEYHNRDEFRPTTYIGQNWDYSETTGKYRNMFLQEDKGATQAKINSGEYKMLNV